MESEDIFIETPDYAEELDAMEDPDMYDDDAAANDGEDVEGEADEHVEGTGEVNGGR